MKYATEYYTYSKIAKNYSEDHILTGLLRRGVSVTSKYLLNVKWYDCVYHLYNGVVIQMLQMRY